MSKRLERLLVNYCYTMIVLVSYGLQCFVCLGCNSLAGFLICCQIGRGGLPNTIVEIFGML